MNKYELNQKVEEIKEEYLPEVGRGISIHNEHGYYMNGNKISIKITGRLTKALANVIEEYEGLYLIKFSKKWLKELSEGELNRTIIHELAHIKAGLKEGHNEKWKRVMRNWGQREDEFHYTTNKIQKKIYNYNLHCPNCGNNNYYVRKGKFVKIVEKGDRECYCGNCGKEVELEYLNKN